MTKIFTVATAGVSTEQPADIDHHRFPRVDYIESQHLLNAETPDYSSYTRNHAGLRDAMQFLAANPVEAKRLGRNARERIVKELSFERYVKSIAEVLMQH